MSRSVVSRPRLLAQLHAAVGNGVTVLQAPAGYGKTVLLSQFVAEVDFRTCWITLDSACAAPETLAERIAGALRQEPVGFSSASRDGDLKAYIGVALAEAIAQSEQPLLLVFDNVHELRNADDAAELVAWFLATLKDGQEAILSGRAAAPLREVDQRIAAGECVLLGKDDLAFTREEVAALGEQLGRQAASDEVHAATSGWPVAVTAVVCGAIVSVESKKLEAGAAWERYLAREVWENLPADVQEILLPLSVCDTVDDPLALELLGDDAYARLQEWIDDHDFLLDLHAEGAFELNPLLRSFMRNRFRRRHPEAFRNTITFVSRWLERRGAIAEAIELTRTLEKGETLAELLQRHSRNLLYHGAFALLWRGFEVLDPQHLEGRPELSAIKARVYSHIGKANQALEQAETVLSQEPSTNARVHALLARERACRLLGRIADLPAVFAEIAKVLDLEDRALLAEVYYAEANFEIQGNSNFARGDELLHRSILNAQRTTFPNLELLARSTLGQLMSMRGDGPAAVNELTRAARGWRAARGTSNLGWVLNNLGMSHLMVGDFESAVTVLEEALMEGKTCENVRNEAYATASLGDANLALGRSDEARKHYEEAIRLCATEVLDESLASLSIAGLAGAFLGLNDLQQADYFAVRALPIAELSGNPLELGSCLMQYAMVKSASGNHAGAIATGNEAIDLFHQVDARGALRTGHYRQGLLHFRARQRDEAEQELEHLAALMTEAWMMGLLLPAAREDPMFAQWVASRGVLGPAFREMVEQHVMSRVEPPVVVETAPFPRVVAQSLGQLRVTVGGREVSDEEWASARAKELFFLFLANRDGLRKEEAVERLYPELSPEKCNSAFHSNVYRIRRALYQDSVVKRQGAYVLNPEGDFEWDVEQFEAALRQASELAPGSAERAARYKSALQLYRGPFAESFYSEWADALRRRMDDHSQEALGTLAGYYAGRDEYESAAACMEELLERNRYNAEAAYQLAIYRVKSGQAAVALALIDEYGRTYEAELGDQLPDRFKQLRSQIAAGAIA